MLNKIALEKAAVVAYSEVCYPENKKGGMHGTAQRIIEAYMNALPIQEPIMNIIQDEI